MIEKEEKLEEEWKKRRKTISRMKKSDKKNETEEKQIE